MRFGILFVSIALAILLIGCVGQGGTTVAETKQPQGAGIQGNQTGPGVPAAPPVANSTEPQGPAATVPQTAGKDDLLLLGRSVSQGWAEYMGLGWDENNTMSGTYQGYRIRRFEVDPPPDIADSAARGMDRFDSDIVFFKLCFVDFSGDANVSLAEDEGYVAKVYDEAVTKRHRKLIVGNALPQVAADTGDGLRYNHEKYDEWLGNFASTHKGIYVLDLYGLLADSNGALRADYEMAPDNSHLNSVAYARITPELMSIIALAKSA
jgi:hypothetical protein